MTQTSGPRRRNERYPRLRPLPAKRRFGSTLLMTAILAGSVSGAVAADGLVDIYELAIRHDPVLKQAEAEYLATLELVPQSRAQILPSINFTANTAQNSQDREFPGNPAFGGEEEFNSHGYSLNLIQPVYHHDSWVQLRQARDIAGRAGTEWEAAQQALVIRVAEAYFAVLAAADNLEFARAEQDAIKRQLEQTRQRFDVGLIAVTDVLEARASFDTAVAQAIEAVNLLSNAREELRELTGGLHEQLLPLKAETPLVKPEPENIEAWTEKSLENNLALRAAEFGREIARKEIAVQRANHFPELDLVASRSNSVSGGGSLGRSDIDETTIMLQLNAPIYQGGGIASQTRVARHRSIQAQQVLVERRRAVISETRQAYLNVVAAISRVNAFRQARISSESALEATEAGFDVGTRTTVDVLLARRNLFLARRDYAQSRYDYILNSLRLKQATGLLAPTDLVHINQWLQNRPVDVRADETMIPVPEVSD